MVLVTRPVVAGMMHYNTSWYPVLSSGMTPFGALSGKRDGGYAFTRDSTWYIARIAVYATVIPSACDARVMYQNG